MYPQPRQPDGKFGHVPRSEADVSLSSEVGDREYNADGTFEFPPIPRSYEQMLAFWRRCPVSDTVIRQMQIAYVEMMQQWHFENLQDWLAVNPEPAAYRAGRPDVELPDHARWQQAIIAEQKRLEGIHPTSISPILAREVARCARLRWQARNCNWIDGVAKRVDETELDLGGLGTTTVSDLLDLYPADELDESVWRDQTPEKVSFIAEQLYGMAGGPEDEGQ